MEAVVDWPLVDCIVAVRGADPTTDAAAVLADAIVVSQRVKNTATRRSADSNESTAVASGTPELSSSAGGDATTAVVDGALLRLGYHFAAGETSQCLRPEHFLDYVLTITQETAAAAAGTVASAAVADNHRDDTLRTLVVAHVLRELGAGVSKLFGGRVLAPLIDAAATTGNALDSPKHGQGRQDARTLHLVNCLGDFIPAFVALVQPYGVQVTTADSSDLDAANVVAVPCAEVVRGSDVFVERWCAADRAYAAAQCFPSAAEPSATVHDDNWRRRRITETVASVPRWAAGVASHQLPPTLLVRAEVRQCAPLLLAQMQRWAALGVGAAAFAAFYERCTMTTLMRFATSFSEELDCSRVAPNSTEAIVVVETSCSLMVESVTTVLRPGLAMIAAAGGGDAAHWNECGRLLDEAERRLRAVCDRADEDANPTR
jgi:hypothetical protein